MSSAQMLPPKMAAQFAEKAKKGLADHNLGGNCHHFFQGNNVISLVSVDPPIGHIRKVSTVEMMRLREETKKAHEELLKVARLAADIMARTDS